MWAQLILVASAMGREYNIKGEVIYEQKGQIIRETFAETKRLYIWWNGIKGWRIMSDLLSYKNYNGTVEFSKEDNCLFGKVIGIKSLISYEGASVKELEQDFHNAVDEYLEDCKERNIEPEQPYKGTFNVRISPELHRTIAI